MDSLELTPTGPPLDKWQWLHRLRPPSTSVTENWPTIRSTPLHRATRPVLHPFYYYGYSTPAAGTLSVCDSDRGHECTCKMDEEQLVV